MDLGLAGRVYVVTGASRGLGYAAASALVDEGAYVVLVARDQDTLDAAVARLGRSAVGISADLANPATCEIATAAALGRFGRLDGALISGGSPTLGGPLRTSDDAWRATFESIFLGGLRMARATVAASTADAGVNGTGASIVFVLSTSSGHRPGLAMLIKDLADEVGPRGIRVNGILPGRHATDNVFAQDAREGDPMIVRRRREASIPLRRYGEPEEFGTIAAFLLSPAASYVTGSVIPANGGASRTL